MDTQKVRNTQFQNPERRILSVGVEDEADSLQHPVRVVLRCGQVRLKHQPHTHGIPSVRGRVDRCTERVLCERDTLVSKRSSIFSFVLQFANQTVHFLPFFYWPGMETCIYVLFLHTLSNNPLCIWVGRKADVTLAHQRIGL